MQTSKLVMEGDTERPPLPNFFDNNDKKYGLEVYLTVNCVLFRASQLRTASVSRFTTNGSSFVTYKQNIRV